MSRQVDHLFATLTGDVVTGPERLPDDLSIRSTYRLSVCNTMREVVMWRNALGMLVAEPPTLSSARPEGFYITIEYTFDRGVKIDARELLNELGLPDSHVERKQIYDALVSLERQPAWTNERKFSYTLGVSRDQLIQTGGIAYLSDVDLVIGFEAHQEFLIHPYSSTAQRRHMNETLPNFTGMQYRLALVDNAGVHGSRFINTGFGVYEISPMTDSQLRDGVYATTKPGQTTEAKTDFYTMDEADEALGLFRTRSEAETFGSPDTRFKAEMREIEQDLTREKADLARVKQEGEREKHRIEEERRTREEEFKREEEARRRRQEEIDAQIKYENDQLERQRERMRVERERMEWEQKVHAERQKFEYDMAQRDRKDRSDNTKALWDTAKAVLGLVSVGLSVYALVKKNQS